VNGDGIRWWHDLTRNEAAEAVRVDPILVLPVAATEQHGPHLPLSTDADIGHGILVEAFRNLGDEGHDAYALPMIRVGTSEEHLDAPGTLSIPPSTLQETIVGIGQSLARTGVRRMVIANTHGGNRAAIDLAALELRRTRRMLIVKANTFRFPRPPGVELPESEWTHGLHGGAAETAMMLHLRPDAVRGDRITQFVSLGEDLEDALEHVGPEGPAAFAWLSGDLNPRGVVGNATLADAAMGERMVRHYGQILAEIIRDTAVFPLGRLSTQGP
jgi:creatinine amidohydrolase